MKTSTITTICIGVLLAACGGGSSGNNAGSDSNPNLNPNPNQSAIELTATASSSTSIDLNWVDNFSDESGFRIERSSTSTSGGFTEIGVVDPNVQSYSDPGRSAGKTYWYRVTAFNAGGDEGSSNVASATTPGAQAGDVPASPTGLVATAISSSAIELNWTDTSNNEDGFRIERSSTSKSTGFTAIAVFGSNVQTYLDDQGDGGGDGGVRPGGGGGGPAASTVASSATTLGLTPGQTYWYRVVAFNANGDSGFSNTASATTLAADTGTVPADPTGLAATATSSTTVELSWTDNSSDEDGFRIERSSTSESTGFTAIAVVGSNVQTYLDDQGDGGGGGGGRPGGGGGGPTALTVASSTTTLGPTPGQTYWYRVVAFNSNGDSGFSNIASVATPSPPLGSPLPPSNLVAAAETSTSIYLLWTDNSDNEDGFKVERGDSSTGPWTEIATIPANSTQFGNASLLPTTVYYYHVMAFNGAGNSGYSNVASAETLYDAAAPVLTGPSTASGQFSLEWTYSFTGAFNSTQDGYELQESETSSTSGFVTLYSTVNQDDRESSKQVWITPDGTGLRYYRVRANDNGTFTPWSNLAVIEVSASTAILRITNDLSGQIFPLPDDGDPSTIDEIDWGKLNQIVWVRIGSTESSLYTDATERLYRNEYTSDEANILSIPPGSYRDFDASEFASGDYLVLIQNGFWDVDGYYYDNPLWTKHETYVVGCDGATSVQKFAGFRITGHTNGIFEVKASEYLPQGNYYGSIFCQ